MPTLQQPLTELHQAQTEYAEEADADDRTQVAQRAHPFCWAAVALPADCSGHGQPVALLSRQGGELGLEGVSGPGIFTSQAKDGEPGAVCRSRPVARAIVRRVAALFPLGRVAPGNVLLRHSLCLVSSLQARDAWWPSLALVSSQSPEADVPPPCQPATFDWSMPISTPMALVTLWCTPVRASLGRSARFGAALAAGFSRAEPRAASPFPRRAADPVESPSPAVA